MPWRSGTVADVMPMTGENRAIVSLGLARLAPPRRVGLAALIRCAGLEDKPVTSVSGVPPGPAGALPHAAVQADHKAGAGVLLRQAGGHNAHHLDVVFYPQINDFRGVRSVQLQVVDLCLAPSRAQLEQAIYDKYSRGDPLTREEARFLLPNRGDFVDLYRWLVRQSTGCTVVEDTPARIARAVSRATRQREIPARTMLCLSA